MVGPGVVHTGGDRQVVAFSDHTDIRPTVLALLGLQDDYIHDGRVLLEMLNGSALPPSLQTHRESLILLGNLYKQINAPFGQLGHDTLTISTAALASDSTNDETYTNLEGKLADWTTTRDAIAHDMRALLDNAAFGGADVKPGEAGKLIGQSLALLGQVHACANNITACSHSR
jgi:hypothetical protein